ncbi:hypothetical protein BBP40_012005 [Aspergillus hancockii]|nr:hypothetical protein BBP40_012005 [Aspergillus hancockii]
MGRDAPFVDLEIQSGTLHLCNIHLERLTSNPTYQIKISQFIQGPGIGEIGLPVPRAAILAGNLNAFAPEDLTASVECGLQDAFLVLGREDGTEESFTWGQQIPQSKRERFRCLRIDKVLFCGGVEVNELERIGAGEMVWIEYPQGSSGEREDSEKGEDMWITDHLGLRAKFRIVEETKSTT